MRTYTEHDPDVVVPLASEPTAMVCGEKIVGKRELGQVKAAH
jgi:hypothetical protein